MTNAIMSITVIGGVMFDGKVSQCVSVRSDQAGVEYLLRSPRARDGGYDKIVLDWYSVIIGNCVNHRSKFIKVVRWPISRRTKAVCGI